MRALHCGVLATVFCLGTGVLADDKKADDKVDAKKLIGKWTAKDKKAAGFTVDFRKDGTFAFGTDSKKEPEVEGKYKLEGNKLTMTLKLGDKEEKLVRTISKLTDTELVSSDENGKQDTLVRAKDK